MGIWNNHTYFFEKPDFSTNIAKKFEVKLMKDRKNGEVKSLKILNDLNDLLLSLDDEFKKDDINKTWSTYLFNETEKGNYLKNQDVFFLLRYVITGNYVGAPIGDIWEVIGKKETLNRIQDALVKFEQ